MEKGYRFLFTADVHGNKYQTLSALLRAHELGLDAVVFGGDISPKEGNNEDGSHFKLGHKTRNPQAQRQFYQDWIIPLFGDFTASTGIDVYTMMSNDDFKVNMDVLEKAGKEGKLKLLHERVHRLPNGLCIVGESYVDLTPFVNKDWEKWDLTDATQMIGEKESRNRFEGYSSSEDGFIGYTTPEDKYFKVDFRTIPRTDSLEARISDRIKPFSEPQQTIYIFHAPPYGTNLDQMNGHKHVGSQAVRKYFEQNGGILGLHGHIHETVDVSGRYEDRVGDTIVAAPGNDPFDHPTNFYTNYSKTLQAIIVEIRGKDINLRRDTIHFDDITKRNEIQGRLSQVSLKYKL